MVAFANCFCPAILGVTSWANTNGRSLLWPSKIISPDGAAPADRQRNRNDFLRFLPKWGCKILTMSLG